jgi:hypothetical protein
MTSINSFQDIYVTKIRHLRMSWELDNLKQGNVEGDMLVIKNDYRMVLVHWSSWMRQSIWTRKRFWPLLICAMQWRNAFQVSNKESFGIKKIPKYIQNWVGVVAQWENVGLEGVRPWIWSPALQKTKTETNKKSKPENSTQDEIKSWI